MARPYRKRKVFPITREVIDFPRKPRQHMAMNKLTDLIDRYIDMWNETDPQRRRDLIARTWTETATYLDPVMQGEGRTGIDAMVQGVQQKFPGHRFRRTSDVDELQDRVRFSWELAPTGGGPAIVTGTDFGVVTDGRLQTITGFFDTSPKTQSQAI